MTEDPKKRFRKAEDQMDVNLTGLLGSLGTALNAAISKLGQSENDQSFDSQTGPVRTHGAIHVRMGGLETGTARAPKPVNPDRGQPMTPKVKPASVRPLVFEVLDDLGTWIVTTEMPGVTLADLALTIDAEDLVVQTSGDRTYHGRLTLPIACRIDQIKIALNNGVLTLQLPEKAAQ